MVDILTHKLTVGQIPQHKPEPHEEKFIRSAMALLVVKSPFFAHLLYNQCTIGYTKYVPIAATDGKYLLFNYEGFKQLNIADIQEVAFVIAHEICHVMLGDLYLMAKWASDGFVAYHDGTKLPYVHDIMNQAEDYRINAMLIEGKVGRMPKDAGLYDPTLSKAGFESCVEIYRKLYEQNGGSSGGKGKGDGKPGQGFDLHLSPGQGGQKSETQREQAIAAAASAAEASGQGSIPSAIKRMLGDILDPKVSWQEQMTSTINRACGDPQYDWRTIDRRLLVRPNPIYFARQSHTGAGLVVVGVDTSGSINNAMINRFFSEMTGIVDDVAPAEMLVIWCDAAVGRIDELDAPEDLNDLYADVQANGVNGGGGTRFQPVFDEVFERGLQPDVLIYLTDGMGPCPIDPGYPVVWAITEGGSKRFTFGSMIDVEL